MTRHCYDTSVLVDLLRRKERSKQLVASHKDQEQVTTVVTAYELALGSTTVQRRRSALRLLEQLQVLPLDPVTAWTAGETMRDLRREGRGPPFRDLFIGVIAREAGCVLHTFDSQFPRIKELDLQIE